MLTRFKSCGEHMYIAIGIIVKSTIKHVLCHLNWIATYLHAALSSTLADADHTNSTIARLSQLLILVMVNSELSSL